MILSAILLTLQDITLTQERDVAITSKAQIGQDAGVHITHPDSGYELWLSGNINYAVTVIELKEEKEDLEKNRDHFTTFLVQLYLFEAKDDPKDPLLSTIPKAVGQAIALLKSDECVIASISLLFVI
ncbi:hypothetical protein V8E53_014148 [Lactarius tabidus]